MGRRTYDPARATRERLLMLERREKARAEARAVAEGVAESVDASRARGAAFEKAPVKRGGAETPYRRLSGLEWLHKKGRITEDQLAAGERYGAAYRRAKGADNIRSILDRDVTAADCPTLAKLLKHAEGTAHAKMKLAMYRGQLINHEDLLAACDAVCGEEKTPREAGANGDEAGRIEAVLKVALDILIQHVAPSRTSEAQDVGKAA